MTLEYGYNVIFHSVVWVMQDLTVARSIRSLYAISKLTIEKRITNFNKELK